MAGRPIQTTLKQINEINLTPLMDLTFILLITFIITFPLIEQGIPVDLPKESADSLESDQSCTITIDREAHVFLNDAPVSVAELPDRLAAASQGGGGLHVMVRADRSVEYGRVVSVLKVLHAAEVSGLALVTEADE